MKDREKKQRKKEIFWHSRKVNREKKVNKKKEFAFSTKPEPRRSKFSLVALLRNMKLLLLLRIFLVFHVPFLQLATVFASSASPPLSSPNSSSSASASASMAALSPGIQIRTEDRKMDSQKKMLIALVVSCSSLGVLLLSFCCLWIYNRKIGHAKNSDSEKGVQLAPFLGTLKTGSRKGLASFMDYKVLEKATSKFHDSNIVGQGGFGCVYKARLEDDSCVAVKKLNCVSEDAAREFENEVDLLSRMRHPNVISLVGYSIDSESRFIVYELMQNGSLETQLHGPSHGSSLTWHMRLKIALDIAKGLEYLHEHCNPPVIHRDLKSSNILLDSDFSAKLSDFGLAVADGGPINKNNLQLSGTVGYVAPEYIIDGKLTDKSDVFAFGVVLLELLFGRKPVEKLGPHQYQSIVKWAMPQLTDRSKLASIVDPVIKDTMDLKHLYQVAAVAVLCVQEEASYRPLITDVVHSLVPLVPVELGGTLRVARPPPNPPTYVVSDSNRTEEMATDV